MKTYGVYDLKDSEQCICLGNIAEIADYLDYSKESLYSYISRKRRGATVLLGHRYELVEIDDIEDTEEDIKQKTNKEIFQELIDAFMIEKPQFELFNKFNWELKGMKDKIIIDEEWKSIDGFNYSVSNYGRIRNDKTKKLKNPRYHRWILQVDIYENAKRYTCDVTRLVAHYFIKEISKDERVRHKDGDIRNNYYKNLEIVSK